MHFSLKSICLRGWWVVLATTKETRKRTSQSRSFITKAPSLVVSLSLTSSLSICHCLALSDPFTFYFCSYWIHLPRKILLLSSAFSFTILEMLALSFKTWLIQIYVSFLISQGQCFLYRYVEILLCGAILRFITLCYSNIWFASFSHWSGHFSSIETKQYLSLHSISATLDTQPSLNNACWMKEWIFHCLDIKINLSM